MPHLFSLYLFFSGYTTVQQAKSCYHCTISHADSSGQVRYSYLLQYAREQKQASLLHQKEYSNIVEMEKVKRALHRAKEGLDKGLAPLDKLAHRAREGVGKSLAPLDDIVTGSRHSSHRSNQSEKSLPVEENGIVFCSSLYHVDSVVKSTDIIRENKNIVDIKFEDLIMGSESDKLFAVEELLVEVVEEKPRRPWASIQFIDGIMSHDGYEDYKEKKKSFCKILTKYDHMINGKAHSINLPIRFWLNVEIHPPMDVITIIQLIQEVAHDETVVGIKFSESLKILLQSTSKRELVAMIDNSALTWRGACCDVAVAFGRPSERASADPSKEIIKDFANSLEEASMSTTNEGRGSNNSLSVLSRASMCNLLKL